MVKEIRSLKTHVIGLERDLSELRRSSSAQTAALMEQTALLRAQNAILKSEMKKLRKEVTRLSKTDRATSSDESEDDSSSDDDSDDENPDDGGSDDDNDNDDGADDQHQAAEPQSSDSESEHEEHKGSSSDSEATESQQRSESQSEFAEEETEIPETETTAAAEPEKLSDVQILDAQSNIATFTVRQLKDFLKRHGWTSTRLNKASIDTMRSEAIKIQLDLVQLLPEGTASAIERDLATSTVSLERTLHPRQMPQPSKHRIVHWRFDADKDCYMVKRITGDTQFFYSTYDLTKLKEEDLRELTDLNLQNDCNNSRAYAFEKFLKKIKKENFDSISKTKKKIMKPKTRKYLKTLGMTKKKMPEE